MLGQRLYKLSQFRAILKPKVTNFQQIKQNTQNYNKKPLPYVQLTFGAFFGSILLYDAIGNEFLYAGASLRFLRSIKTATIISLNYMWLFAWHAPDENDYEQLLQEVHQKSAERLLKTCLLNGGLYIKVGQGFAAINHILPKEYTSTLAQLQDECLPTSKKDVKRVFEKEFGQMPEEIYAKFNYTPVAAASLAQVFKAQLHNGQKVAVKVQYNDLKKRFTSDLSTMIMLQDIIEWCFKSYNFGWIMRDLRENLVQELNFLHEAENAERCAQHLKKFHYVHVPKVHWKYTTARVLTLEWIDGCKISDVASIQKQMQLDLRDVDLKLFRVFAEQIFNTGFVHADPHPGNIFVRKNKNTGQADIIVLDHGLYEQLPEQFRVPLCEFWEATVLRDEAKMQKAASQLKIKDYMKFAEILFQQPIRIHGGKIKTKLTQQDIDYMQEVARKNFDLIMSTLKEMPRNMLFIVRNLNTIRAVGRQHGDVVDRPREMARHAQSCIYARQTRPFSYFRWLYRRFIFEYSIWRTQFKINCMNWYFYILYYIGRAPESATTIMKDIMKQPDIR